MNKQNLFENIKNSMGEFPPFYPEYRNWKSTNCYAHALNLHYPIEHDYYCPGMLAALSKGGDIFDDVLLSILDFFETGTAHTYTSSEIDFLVKGIKRDCIAFGLYATECDFTKPCTPNSYKILLYTFPAPEGWHFVRESITWEGERIWTHNPGYNTPTEEIDLSKNHISFTIEGVTFTFRKCLEINFSKLL